VGDFNFWTEENINLKYVGIPQVFEGFIPNIEKGQPINIEYILVMTVITEKLILSLSIAKSHLIRPL
jgi:hypothetical protein